MNKSQKLLGRVERKISQRDIVLLKKDMKQKEQKMKVAKVKHLHGSITYEEMIKIAQDFVDSSHKFQKAKWGKIRLKQNPRKVINQV